ncbi:MAG TPA: methyl-accepting chemotaxis protein [Acidocella sp.]|nr:methyl-accepting chemotaxis protein [Acidocella sp.]
MLHWIREVAPIRQKLKAVFWMMAGLVTLGGACGFLALLSPLAAGGGLLLVVGGTLWLGGVLREAIAGPYVSTVERMEALAAGDLNTAIQFTTYGDCVGRMTKAMHTFRETALAKIAAERDTEQQRQQAETIREEILARQRGVVDALADALAKLAAGDLVFRLNTPFSQDYEKLRGDFNVALDKLQETMRAIANNTQAVSAGAGEITQASDDLARRTEQQAATLEETAASLNEITTTVRKTAEGANESSKVVASTQAEAERSGEVVRDTVAAMSKIEASSRQISNIIGVIDEIAFQTNLLALNAGVEAARAGDAGRGFAVVATEVRALAQRSADAAKEIKALISTSGAQVEAGVRLVGETGMALERIATQIAQLNILSHEISSTAQEQATGLAQVNEAMNQMDQVTQQNAAMVEQTTAASHSLSQEAGELARLVNQFQTGQQKSRAAPQSPKQSRIPVHAPRPRALATTHTSQESWNEF